MENYLREMSHLEEPSDDSHVEMFPPELMNIISTFAPDSRPIYLSCSKYYNASTDKIYWESTGFDRIKNHIPKIKTHATLGLFVEHDNVAMVRHIFDTTFVSEKDTHMEILTASMCGSMKVFKYFYEEMKLIRECKDSAYEACMFNQLDIIKYLHEKGIYFGRYNTFLVNMTKTRGYEELSKLLLEHGDSSA